MQELDGGRRGIRSLRIAVAAGPGHRQAQARADARPAGTHRIPQGLGETVWTTRALSGDDGRFECLLNTLRWVH